MGRLHYKNKTLDHMKKQSILKKDIKIVNKDIRIVNSKVKPYERDPRSWNTHQRIIIVGGAMIIISLYSKILNLFHWTFVTKFDMSSYPPEVAYTYMLSSMFALIYGYMKKDKILEFLGLVGLGYTLIFCAGMIKTYML